MRTFGSSNIFDNLKNKSHKIINFKFSLGTICPNVKIQRFLYKVNENSFPFGFDEIRTDGEIIISNIEGFEYLGKDYYLENINKYKNENLNEIVKNNFK